MTSCWTDSARKGQYINFTPFARPRSPRTIRSNFGARQAALRRLPVLYLPGRLEGGHARVDEPTRQLIKSIDSAANRGSSRYPSTREASFQVFNDRSRSKRSVRLCLYRSRNRLGKTGGVFPLDAGRVFPRHGGQGQGGRAQPCAHNLGLSPSEIAQFASAWQGRGHATGAADLELTANAKPAEQLGFQ